MTEMPALTNPAEDSPVGSTSDAETPDTGVQPVPATERRRRRKLLLLLLLLLAFLILAGVAIWYLLFRLPINVIPPIPGQAVLPKYSTSIYGPNRPLGVAVTADGSRLFVTESEGERTARVLDGAGALLGSMLPPLSTGGDHVPIYTALDPISGEIYVSDRPTGAIYVYDQGGTYLRQYTAPATLAGWQPLGLAFDGSGNLYVTDLGSASQQVVVLDRAGQIVRTIGDKDGLSFPNGVAVDSRGFVYVTDSNNGRMLVYDQNGNIVAQVGRGADNGRLGLPRGIAVSKEGLVYVADATGQTVQVFRTYQDGQSRLEYIGGFGGQGIADGQFEYPNGLALDTRGRVYVTDSGNDRVQVWSY